MNSIIIEGLFVNRKVDGINANCSHACILK